MYLYRTILKKSAQIIWKFKHLWFFGFFAAFLGSFLEFEIIFNRMGPDFGHRFLNNIGSIKSAGIFSKSFLFNFGNLFKNDPISMIILLTITLIVLVLLGFLIWLSMVSQGGLVNNTANIVNNKGETNIQVGVESGVKNFWKIFGINLVVKFFVYFILLILSLLIFFTSYSSSLLSSMFLVNALLFIVFIPLALILAFIAKYAICYAVIEGDSFILSIKKAFNLFIRNWLVSIEMAFILFFLSFIVGLVILIGLTLAFIPILLLFNLAVYFSWIMLSFWIFIVGIIILAVLMALAGSAFSAFRITAWTEFFIRLNSSKGSVSKLARLVAKVKK
ncbi:choline transporter-like family protein [bacterium]|nr:choline transporter-like family protein [bacterium]